ncbi:hypothetical protein [Fischerella sp. PCC 9605]|nr:hypothetical protein [Fischerella sp. PCC 9605]
MISQFLVHKLDKVWKRYEAKYCFILGNIIIRDCGGDRTTSATYH